MATVYERNGGWYIYFRYHGRRYRELAGSDINKRDAEQYLAKRMREVQKEDIYDKKPVLVPFSTFADEYRALIGQHTQELEQLFTGSRIDYTVLDTSKPLDYALFRYLSSREKMARVR